jgi:hypothetical protein
MIRWILDSKAEKLSSQIEMDLGIALLSICILAKNSSTLITVETAPGYNFLRL